MKVLVKIIKIIFYYILGFIIFEVSTTCLFGDNTAQWWFSFICEIIWFNYLLNYYFPRKSYYERCEERCKEEVEKKRNKEVDFKDL